nr:leucine--tRNA ligase, cytoplasmic [Tanacetum cinerariifolium]
MVDKENGSSFKRRDELLEMEHEARKWWDESRVFEAEAKDEPAKDGEKFFATFPIPYMNGHLHLDVFTSSANSNSCLESLSIEGKQGGLPNSISLLSLSADALIGIPVQWKPKGSRTFAPLKR